MNSEEKRKFVQELTALIRLELNKDFHHILKSLTIPIEPIVEAVRKSFKVDIEEAKNEIEYSLKSFINQEMKRSPHKEKSVSTSKSPTRKHVELASLITSWNQLEYTKMCLYSFFRQVTVPQELVLFDNNSEDGTWEYFKRLEKLQPHPMVRIIIHKSPTNIGFCKATEWFWSQYLLRDEVKYLFRCKTTFSLPLHTQEDQLRVLKSNRGIGMVGLAHGAGLQETKRWDGVEELPAWGDMAGFMIKKQLLLDYPEFQDVHIRCDGWMALDFWGLKFREDKGIKGCRVPHLSAMDFKLNPYLSFEDDRIEYLDAVEGRARWNIVHKSWIPQSLAELRLKNEEASKDEAKEERCENTSKSIEVSAIIGEENK